MMILPRSLLPAALCLALLSPVQAAGIKSTPPAPVANPAPAAAATSAPTSPEERLSQGRKHLTTVEQNLDQRDLTDTTLDHLRAEVDAVGRLARSVMDEVTPRMAVVHARLEQLGPKPTDTETDTTAEAHDKQAPPTASPDKPAPDLAAINAERDQQQKLYDGYDLILKQARVLAVDVDQAIARIAARRRDLFNHAVFTRSASLIDPTLWSNAAHEAPSALQNTAALSQAWISGLNARMGALITFGIAAFLALFVAGYLMAAKYVRRALALEDTKPDRSDLAKVLGAFLVAGATIAVPILTVLVFAQALRGFGLVTERGEPLLSVFVMGITRTAMTVGLCRALLAPSRPTWRLIDLENETCARLMRLAISIAIVVSFAKLFDAAYELIGASLSVAVVTRGVFVVAVAGMMAHTLRGIQPNLDGSEECLGPRVVPARDWFGPLRILAWIVIAILFVAVLLGFVAFAMFLTTQVVWVSFVGTMLFLLLQLTQHGGDACLQPGSPMGRAISNTIGLRRESLQQIAAVLTGFLSLALYATALILVLTPWGIQSDDVFGSLQSAFFEFRIGDVTISPSNIVLALVLFVLCLGATRGFQNWLDHRFLPLTQLDTGLRNSIRTSLGYLGFIIAAATALGEVGLDFQKLAIVAGALSVGIGFGLQSIVNNFVSGLIILWERAIRVGDWVVLGDEQGHVRRINVRSTEIETFDRATMIVPNSNLVSGVVKNWVRGDRTGRIRIQLAVPINTDPESVRTILMACAKGHELVLRIPAPQVYLSAIGGTDLKFDLLVYVADVETSLRTRSDLNFEILRRFAEAGITIAQSPPTAIVNFHGLVPPGHDMGDLNVQILPHSAPNPTK